jgi:acyl-CoA thioester hydrolase
MTEDLLRVKIYYEDTDCGGVVYYANYLRYFERARTEFLESRGVSLKSMMERNVFFVVADVGVKYLAPARYGDTLLIHTTVEESGRASLSFGHRVTDHAGKDLVTATVRLACVGADMRPRRLAGDILAVLEER